MFEHCIEEALANIEHNLTATLFKQRHPALLVDRHIHCPATVRHNFATAWHILVDWFAAIRPTALLVSHPNRALAAIVGFTTLPFSRAVLTTELEPRILP
jgi:hypothetical protein